LYMEYSNTDHVILMDMQIIFFFGDTISQNYFF
jgi:hypothetical protein